MTLRRGWCPSVFMPMESGDGWLARVKPRTIGLTADALRTIADAAARHGNGRIELTGRANLQIRGLTPDSAPRFAAEMVAAGLASPEPAAERRRNVIVSPLPDTDTLRVAEALEIALQAASHLAALPDKFCFLVDGGPLPVGAIRADIRIRMQDGQVILEPDGGDVGAACRMENAIPAALRLASAFIGQAGAEQRMRHVVQRIPAAMMLQEAGLRPMPLACPRAAQPSRVVGPIQGDRAFGFGFPFGQTDAQSMRRLADVAGNRAVIRTTPWRSLLLCGHADGTHPPALPGFITDPADPRLRITACAGAPACARASVDVRTDAALLAFALPGITAHVSGCAKGCAHPAPSAITLTGRDGCYDLIRDGRAADKPAAHGLTISQVMALLRQTGKETAA